MEKILKIFLLTTIFLLTNFFTAESAPAANNYGKLKVGYVVNTSFMSEDRPGHTVSYGYEYIEILENYVPCEFEYIVFDDWTDLLNRLNWSMNQLLMNQSDIRDVLKRKYFLKEGFPLLLTRSEKNFLAEKKKLRAAVLLQGRPRVYRDNSGNLTGFMVEIVKRISEDLNVEIEIVETNSYEKSRDLIQNGEIDFLVDAICDYSWAEKYKKVYS